MSIPQNNVGKQINDNERSEFLTELINQYLNDSVLHSKEEAEQKLKERLERIFWKIWSEKITKVILDSIPEDKISFDPKDLAKRLEDYLAENLNNPVSNLQYQSSDISQRVNFSWEVQITENWQYRYPSQDEFANSKEWKDLNQNNQQSTNQQDWKNEEWEQEEEWGIWTEQSWKESQKMWTWKKCLIYAMWSCIVAGWIYLSMDEENLGVTSQKLEQPFHSAGYIGQDLSGVGR